mgnify:CR=1 FL=1
MKNHSKKVNLFLDDNNGKPFTGVHKTFYFSESNPLEIIGVKSRANYKNGKLHGLEENFTIKGKFKNGAHHHNGNLNKEIWNWDYLTERPSRFIFRKNRQTPFTGEIRVYYKKAKKHQFKPIKPDVEIDPSNSPISGFEDIYRVFNVVGGKREGYEESYYRSGALKTQGKYTNNELNGVFKTFTNVGITQTETYKSGEPSKKVRWLDADGNVIHEGKYKHKLFDGLWPQHLFEYLKEDLVEKGQWFLRPFK